MSETNAGVGISGGIKRQTRSRRLSKTGYRKTRKARFKRIRRELAKIGYELNPHAPFWSVCPRCLAFRGSAALMIQPSLKTSASGLYQTERSEQL